jgi:hypothetical protein
MKSELLCHMDGIASTTNSDPTKSIVILGKISLKARSDLSFGKKIYILVKGSKK